MILYLFLTLEEALDVGLDGPVVLEVDLDRDLKYLYIACI